MGSFSRFGSLLLVILIATVPSYLVASPAGPADAKADRLASTSVFTIGGVGYAGRISDGQTAFEEIAARPKDRALETFEHVYATGSPAAKAYALLGFHTLAPSRFVDIYASLPNGGLQIETMQGCIMDRSTLFQVAKSIASGEYDAQLHRYRATSKVK